MRAPTSAALFPDESSLVKATVKLAVDCGWRVSHSLPSPNARGRWLTATQGHPGAPDVLLARRGQIHGIELKSQTGRPTADQLLWLDAFGDHGHLWRPSDWHLIQDLLTGKD